MLLNIIFFWLLSSIYSMLSFLLLTLCILFYSAWRKEGATICMYMYIDDCDPLFQSRSRTIQHYHIHILTLYIFNPKDHWMTHVATHIIIISTKKQKWTFVPYIFFLLSLYCMNSAFHSLSLSLTHSYSHTVCPSSLLPCGWRGGGGGGRGRWLELANRMQHTVQLTIWV